MTCDEIAAEMVDALLRKVRRRGEFSSGAIIGLHQALSHLSPAAREAAEKRIREAFCGVQNL